MKTDLTKSCSCFREQLQMLIDDIQECILLTQSWKNAYFSNNDVKLVARAVGSSRLAVASYANELGDIFRDILIKGSYWYTNYGDLTTLHIAIGCSAKKNTNEMNHWILLTLYRSSTIDPFTQAIVVDSLGNSLPQQFEKVLEDNFIYDYLMTTHKHQHDTHSCGVHTGINTKFLDDHVTIKSFNKGDEFLYVPLMCPSRNNYANTLLRIRELARELMMEKKDLQKITEKVPSICSIVLSENHKQLVPFIWKSQKEQSLNQKVAHGLPSNISRYVLIIFKKYKSSVN